MRILIDIGHPAHVHYFRNYYFKMISRGHEVLITSRDKEVCFALLKAYQIPFISRGSGKNSTLGKLFYMFHADLMLFNHARKFKPDVFLSFA
jgi:predicted glycosyltransferase